MPLPDFDPHIKCHLAHLILDRQNNRFYHLNGCNHEWPLHSFLYTLPLSRLNRLNRLDFSFFFSFISLPFDRCAFSSMLFLLPRSFHTLI